MPAFLLPLLGGVWRAVIALMSSPVGWCLAAFVAGWMISGHRVRAQWAEETAAEKAAYQREVARQETAAKEIAGEATKRLVEEQALTRDLQAHIEAFDREESVADAPPSRTKPSCTPAVIRPCRVDDAFADRVRQFDAAADRARPPSRKTR
jgi:hypothetical protein